MLVGGGGRLMYFSHQRLTASLLTKPKPFRWQVHRVLSQIFAQNARSSQQPGGILLPLFIIIYTPFAELASDMTKTTSDLH